jgi:ABC-type multidrug transport system fused ATPase/permease subunit
VELRQTIDMTRVATGIVSLEQARDPGSGMKWSSSPEAVEELEQYKDGEKLQSLVDTLRDKVFPSFGRQLVGGALVTEAKQLAAKVATRRAAAVRRIWLIFRPLAKRWCLGTVILMVTEGMWGVLYGHLMSLCNLGFSLQPDTMAEAGRYAATIAAGFLLVFPFDNLGDTLVDAVEAKMQLGLRSTVMGSLLRQDREFFDHHQSGVLQERLNKDTEDLARTIIQQPKNLLSALTRIITKSAYLYYLSPGLFWVGVCIPVPICCIVETLGFKKLRTADTKIGKVNDQAAASTSDLLREISTVRQFGMEETELNNFTTIGAWSAAGLSTVILVLCLLLLTP